MDFAFGRPGGQALAAAGKRFVCRYLAYSGAAGGDERKFLTAPEIADYQDNGLAVVANFESTSNRMLDGAAAGAADANDARSQMVSLGFPVSCPVYFSADFDPQPQYLARIDAYLSAAASVLGKARVGIYGGIDALTHTRQSGTAAWFWMAAGWDHGSQPPAFVHLWQYQTAGQGAPAINGAAVDNDRALLDNYGQWDAPPSGGPVVEEPVYNFTQDTTKPTGSLLVSATSHSYLDLATGATHPIPAGTNYTRACPGRLDHPIPGGVAGADRQTAYLVAPAGSLTAVLASDGLFTPTQGVDCTAAVEAATAPLEAKIKNAQEALA